MTSEEFFEQCRKIGPAVWLLMLYWAASDGEEMPWFEVMDGEPLGDQEVAAVLRVSVHTAVRWRKKLQRQGFIKAQSGAGGFRIHVLRPSFAMAVIRALEAHGQREWPKLATELVQ
jgi:hypothetical protein